MRLVVLLGPWLYPLAGVALVLAGDVIRAAIRVAASEGVEGAAAPHHTVLAWGVVAAAVGILGTLSGIGRVAFGARAVAGGERAELEGMLDVVWEGALVAVTPATVGLALFALSLIAWIMLQYAVTRRRV